MKRLCELKKGEWFRFISSKHKCKYFGEVDSDIVPNKKLYLFRRDHNGQGYFILTQRAGIYEKSVLPAIYGKIRRNAASIQENNAQILGMGTALL